MERIAKFEKVSEKEWERYFNLEHCVLNKMMAYEFISERNKWMAHYENIKVPERSTKSSAGYDFFAPFDFAIYGGQNMAIPTGIRVSIDDGWFLQIVPKSGVGTKHALRFMNTVGVIDGDYYYSANEGHIMASLRKETDGSSAPCKFKQGEKMFQGIFVPYGITHDDNAQGERNGGHGSTGR